MAKGRRSDFVPRSAQPTSGLQPGMLEKIKKIQEDMAATQLRWRTN